MTKEYKLMGLSSFHYRLFYLFLTLCNKCYEVHLDNIYMSTKYSDLSYTYLNHVKVKVECQARGWEILGVLLKTKLHDKKVADQAW